MAGNTGGTNIFLLLGSNLDDPVRQLQTAINRIKENGIEVENISSIYSTEAWGNTDQPDFLNMALKCTSDLQPIDLMHVLLDIERSMGRVRTGVWEPRIIDIDMIFYGGVVLDTEDLVLPHPRMHLRNFVLTPLAEIAPGFIHPVFHRSISELLDTCEDDSLCTKLN